MKVFVDKDGCIRAVGTTTDTSLTEVIINDKDNPFKDWSAAKICCYKVTVQDGIVIMYTPYVDSNLIAHIDQLGKETEALQPYETTGFLNTGQTEIQFLDVPNGIVQVIVNDPENQGIDYNTTVLDGIVTVFFTEPLKYAVDITVRVER